MIANLDRSRIMSNGYANNLEFSETYHNTSLFSGKN